MDTLLFSTLVFLMGCLLISYWPYRRRLRENPGEIIRLDGFGRYILWFALFAFILDIAAIALVYSLGADFEDEFYVFSIVYYSLQFAFLPSAYDRFVGTRFILGLCVVAKTIGFSYLASGTAPVSALACEAYVVMHVLVVDLVWYGFFLIPEAGARNSLWNGDI